MDILDNLALVASAKSQSNSFNSTIIGCISQDQNIDYKGNEENILGGAVLYSCASAYALGHRVNVIHKLREQNAEFSKEFRVPQEFVQTIFCNKTYKMKNVYLAQDMERRISTCQEQGCPITLSDIPDNTNTKLFYLAGLINGDFSDELITEIHKKSVTKKAKVAIDAQGLLRCLNKKTRKMALKDYPTKKQVFPYLDFLKVDTAEGEILTGETDRTKMAQILLDFGAKEVMITNHAEVLACNNPSEIKVFPIKSRSTVGRTGRGDTTFSAFVNERVSGKTIAQALVIATGLVSLKQETPGQFMQDRNAVIDFIKTQWTTQELSILE